MTRFQAFASLVLLSVSPLCACVGDSPPTDPWGCLADPEVPSDEAVLVRMTVLDETTEEPIAGARVAMCLRSDLECATPSFAAATDSRGIIHLTMADEYLQITAEGYRDTLAMGLGSLEVTAGRKAPIDVHFDLYPSATFEALATASGVDRVAELADIEVLVRDCAYESAGGASADLDARAPETAQRYLVNDLPSTTARETDVASGSVLFFNAPPGLRSVSAVVVESGLPIIGEDRVLAVLARKGWLTQAAMVPPSVDIRDIEGD